MDRTTRVPLVMAIIAVAGIGLLAGLSGRYAKLADAPRVSRSRPAGPPQRPAQNVDAAGRRFERFVTVREVLRAAIEAAAPDAPAPATLLELRDREILGASWSVAEYEATLADYRLWKAALASPAVCAGLDPFRRRLVAAHLGRFETQDL